MKKTLYLLTSIFTLLILAGCNLTNQTYDIVTTMFTEYDLTKAIVEDKMSVKMLLTPGQELHGFEASSQDMIDIENSKLFIFTSTMINNWITDPNALSDDDTYVLNMYEKLLLTTTFVDDNVHYWIDPVNAILMIDIILDEIVQIDPSNQTFYEANALNYQNLIQSKINEFNQYLLNNNINSANLYVAGHNAFESFGHRFGFNTLSIFNEFEPDADLTSSELLSFVNIVLETNTHYIFMDALEDPKTANTIKDELLANHNFDLQILKLYAYQNLTQDDFDQHVNYLDLMDRNFTNIKDALGV